ncbi:MAG: asparagine synthase [Bacilli bacterium]|nr:asparagine synthase [Bacilli bacterium]
MKQGLIPTIVGAGVTALGVTLTVRNQRKQQDMMTRLMPLVSAGIIGFGLAHVLLGTIDLVD